MVFEGHGLPCKRTQNDPNVLFETPLSLAVGGPRPLSPRNSQRPLSHPLEPPHPLLLRGIARSSSPRNSDSDSQPATKSKRRGECRMAHPGSQNRKVRTDLARTAWLRSHHDL